MFTTRGVLVPARIEEVGTLNMVNFMFNPYEYKVTRKVKWNRRSTGDANSEVEMTAVTEKKLSLPKLVFDVYEDLNPLSAVTDHTDLLIEMMEPTQDSSQKPKPRQVKFVWGPFEFPAYIETVEQTFTLFKKDGTPVRAEVQVTLLEFTEEMAGQNPTSGEGPMQRVHRVQAGDRLDTIAFQVYGDATHWRLIAAYNRLEDPFSLRPGLELGIPEI